MKEIDLLPYQYDWVSSNDPNVALVAGVGTGKTHAGAMFVLRMISEYPNTKGMIVANTYSQLMNATLEPLIELLDDLGVPYTTSLGAKKKITIMGTTVYLYSLENYKNIRGIEVGWIWADEFFLNRSADAYNDIITRMRDKNGPQLFRATSTKNGFNWAYDLYSAPDKTTTYKIIEATSDQNPFIHPKFIADMLELYGSQEAPMFRQEVLNEYVNLTDGCVYYGFDRSKHVKPATMEPDDHVWVGVDFNIDNMNAVYCIYKENILYVTRALHLTAANANTFSLAGHLQKDLFEYPNRSIVPDSTGKARKTSSQKSDHQILRDAGFNLKVTHNPPIRDRQNAVNRMLNQNRIVIDPSCKTLIRELETLASRDEEGKTSHIAVALGYVIWMLDPLKKRGRSRSFKYLG